MFQKSVAQGFNLAKKLFLIGLVLILGFVLVSSTKATDLYLSSMDDVIANSTYDEPTRTYIVEADNIFVTGNISLSLDGVTPRNIDFRATNEFRVESSAMVSANGGNTTDGFYGGPGGLVSIDGASVAVSGSISANGGFGNGGGSGGSVTITAGAVSVTGVVTADGSSAKYVNGGRGGSITVSGSTFTLSGRITANGGAGGTYTFGGGVGGTITITGGHIDQSAGLVVAKGGDATYFAGQGGSVVITAEMSMVTGNISVDGGEGKYYYDPGAGGTLLITTEILTINGLISANGGSGFRSGYGGIITISASTITVNVPISAKGGDASGATGGSGGVINLTASSVVINTSVSANGGLSWAKGGPGGNITITAKRVTLNGSISANGADVTYYYDGGEGGNIKVNASELLTISGLLVANGGDTQYGWLGGDKGGPGGTITLEGGNVNVSNGLIKANGGQGPGGYGLGGTIKVYYVAIIPKDELITKTHFSAKIGGTITFIQKDTAPPEIVILSPEAKDYLHSETFVLNFTTTDTVSGISTMTATLNGENVISGQVIDLFYYSLGEHTLVVKAEDKAGNKAEKSVKFNVIATIDSLIAVKERCFELGWIDKSGIKTSLDAKLENVKKKIESSDYKTAENVLNAFLNEVNAQTEKSINLQAANLLTTDASYVIVHLYPVAAPMVITADPTFTLREIYVFPNPAKDGKSPIIRALVGIADKVEIRIYDLAGELVSSEQLAGSSKFRDKSKNHTTKNRKRNG